MRFTLKMTITETNTFNLPGLRNPYGPKAFELTIENYSDTIYVVRTSRNVRSLGQADIINLMIDFSDGKPSYSYSLEAAGEGQYSISEYGLFDLFESLYLAYGMTEAPKELLISNPKEWLDDAHRKASELSKNHWK